MEFIQKLLNLRNVADPVLIGRENLLFSVLAILVGLMTGLGIAHAIWYRSARRLRDLEAVSSQLREGDIDIRKGLSQEGSRSNPVGPPAESVTGAALLDRGLDKRMEVSSSSTNHQLAAHDEQDLPIADGHSEVRGDGDDLTLLEGVSRERADELNRAGFFRFSQLAELDEEERRKFAFRFGWSDINWGAWAAAASGSAALFHRSDTELLDRESAQVTCHEEGGGISSVLPIAQEATSWPGEDDWSRNWLSRGLSSSTAAAGSMDAYYQNAEHLRKTVTPVVELNEWGRLWHRRGLDASSPMAGAMLGYYANRGAFDHESEAWSRNWIGRNLRTVLSSAVVAPTSLPVEVGTEVPQFDPRDAGEDRALSTAYSFAPEDADDLTLLMGIDAEKAAELNRAGIYKFSQLEEMDEENRSRLVRRFKWPEINWGKWEALGLIGAGAAGGVAELLGKDGEEEEKEVLGDTSLQSHEFIEGSPEKAVVSEATLPDIQQDWTWVTTDQGGQTDLTLIEGVTSEDAARLRSEGIYTIEQLQRLPEEKRSEIKNSFGWADIDWAQWSSLGALGSSGVTAMSDLGRERGEDPTSIEVSASASVLAGREDTEADETWGRRFRERPADADDLTSMGITSEEEAELNREGVYTFRQLEVLPEEKRTDLKKRFGWTDVEWGKWATQGAIGTGVASAMASNWEDGDRQDDTAAIDPLGAQATTSWSAKKTDNDPVDEGEIPVQGDSNTAEAIGSNWDSGRDSDTVAIDPLGVQVSSWNAMETEAVTNAIGIGTVSAIGLDKGEVGADDETVPIDPRAVTSPPFRVTENETGESEESRVSQDNGKHWTWNYKFSGEDSSPEGGIGVGQSDPLHSSNLGYEERKSGWGDIDWGKWATVGAAGGVGLIAKTGDHKATSREDVVWETERDPLSEAIRSKENTLPFPDPSDLRLTEVYSSQPDLVDDLTEINGISLGTESKLNRLGIYTFKQIAHWGGAAVEAVEDAIGIPGCVTQGQWIAQARDFIGEEAPVSEMEPDRPGRATYAGVLELFEGENVDIHENFGVVYQSLPKVQDDLKQIKGVGKQIEGELNERGVFRFKQIAHWNDYNVWAFGQSLGFPGKITREEWVSQAKSLILGEAGRELLVSAPSSVGTGVLADQIRVGLSEPMSAVATPAVGSNLSFESDWEEPRGIFGTGEAGEDGEARRVAYILDVSRSLTPTQLRLSKMELASAIRDLPAESYYQVIFFSGPSWFAHQRMVEGGARGEDVVIQEGNTYYKWTSGFGGFEFEYGNENLPTSEWRRATPENISFTLNDIEAVGKSYGTTWHLPLTMALHLDPAPHTVYFLTDGETARQEQVAEEMIDLVRKRGQNTRIHTIALMVPGASVPLNRIASGTGGEYCLVIAGGKVLKNGELLEYLAEKDISMNG